MSLTPFRVNATDRLTLPSLCHYCQYIFDHWSEVIEDEYQVKFFHCENFFALQVSATRGCILCGQFLRNLARRGQVDAARDSTIELLNNGLLPLGCWIRVISFDRILSSRRITLPDCKLLELRFWFDNLEDEQDDGDRDFSEDHSSSEENIEYEDDEFKDPGTRSPNEFVCKVILMPAITEPLLQQNSQNIAANTKDALDLAKTWLNSCRQFHNNCVPLQNFSPTRILFIAGENVKLCLSSTLPQSTSYATLSHCWGSVRHLKLTRRNFQLLLKGLPVGNLCKTFQDAVYVSQELGLQYLWIDSLCIIQDDTGDWTSESKMMSKIYSGSTINIAASSAADGDGGLFFYRDAKHSWRHRVETKIHGRDVQYECIEDGISDACLFETPLANRAWAIQERLLAPRTLHCSLSQLFWECNSTTACEAFPQKFPDALKYDDFHLPKQPVSRSLWPTIVKLYSRCQLTFGRDKLVAISGIARTIYEQDVDDGYVAGLWRRGIEQQLCWKVQDQRPKVETPRAPSWSWASVDGIVDFPFVHESRGRRYIDVLDVSIGVHDPFGEIPTGKITLRCLLLLQGTLDNTGGVFRYRIKLGSRTHQIRCTLDCLSEQPKKIHLLPVENVAIGNSNVRGLILQPSERDPAEYQRIGYFGCNDSYFDECSKPESQARNRVPCEALDAGNMIVITIM